MSWQTQSYGTVAAVMVTFTVLRFWRRHRLERHERD